VFNNFPEYNTGNIFRRIKNLAEDNDVKRSSRGFRLAVRSPWNAGRYVIDASRVDGEVCEQRGISQMTYEGCLLRSNEANMYKVLPRDRTD